MEPVGNGNPCEGCEGKGRVWGMSLPTSDPPGAKLGEVVGDDGSINVIKADTAGEMTCPLCRGTGTADGLPRPEPDGCPCKALSTCIAAQGIYKRCVCQGGTMTCISGAHKGKPLTYQNVGGAGAAPASLSFPHGESTYTGGKVWNAKACDHKGLKPVFKINGCDVYAVASHGFDDDTDGDLILDCAGFGPRPLILPPGLESLRKHWIPAANTIYLPWPDGSVPPVTFGFWRDLAKRLPKKGSLVVTCWGAHGRTGTAIAALLLATRPSLSARAAMALVRKRHCDQAIETAVQEDYLDEMAAARPPRPPAKGKGAPRPPRKPKSPPAPADPLTGE